jgi:hypothetical protein
MIGGRGEVMQVMVSSGCARGWINVGDDDGAHGWRLGLSLSVRRW